MPQAVPLLFSAGIAHIGLEGATLVFANLAIAILSNMLANKLADDPRQVDNPIKTMVRSNIRPRQLVYGRALITGPVLAFYTFDKVFDDSLFVAVALTGHPIAGYDVIHLDEFKIKVPDDLIGSRFTEINAEDIEGSGRLYYLDGKDPDSPMALDMRQNFREPWCNFPGNVLNNATALACTRKLNQVAYVGYILKFDREIWGGIPNLKVEIRGKEVLDIQEMFTLEQAAQDPLTATLRYSTNWADCVLDYLMDPNLGLGIPLEDIDLLSFNAAAVLSDEQVETFVGSGEFVSRYTCNGAIQLDATPISILESLLTAGFGSLTYTQGKYKLFGGEYTIPLVAAEDIITEDDLAGPVKIQISTPRADRFSAVRGTYVDVKTEFTDTTFPEVVNETYRLADVGSDNYLDSALNGYVYKEISLPFTIEVSTAQRLAKLLLDRARQALVVEIVVNITGLKYSVGDNVKVNFPTITLGDDTNPGFIAATANTPTLAAGLVTGISVLEKGAGYIYPPLVRITGNGIGAMAIAVLEAGSISEIIITDAGTGYTTASVAITDPSALQAGWIDKVFKVESWTPNENGTIAMVLHEDAASIYVDFDTITQDTTPDIQSRPQPYEYAPRNISLNTGAGFSAAVDGGGWSPAIEASFTEARLPSLVDHYEIQIGLGNNASFGVNSVFANAPVEEPALSGKYTSIVDLELLDTVLNVPSTYASQGDNSAIGAFNFNINIGTVPLPEYVDNAGNFQNYGDNTDPTPTAPPGATGLPSISSLSVTAGSSPPSSSSSEYLLKITGAVNQNTGAGEQFLENWLQSTVGIIPANWEVLATATGYTLFTGTLGIWMPLSTERSWQVFSSNGTFKSTELLVTIREIALPANAKTALITLSIAAGVVA